MVKRYYWLFILILITLGVIAANGWVMKHRYSGFLQKNVSYAALYNLKDTPVIFGTDLISPGKLRVALSHPSANQWLITPAGGESYTVAGRFPVIDLLERQHSYTIQPLPVVPEQTPIVLEVLFNFRSRSSGGIGAPAKDYHRIVQANVPIGALSPFTIDDYIYQPAYFPERDVRRAYASIVREIGIDEADGTAVKIQKLALYLLDRLDNKRGQPTQEMYRLSPYAQYQAALQGRSKVWCFNYHHIYNFFANLLGIPTRRVSIYSGVNADGRDLEEHSFNESYIEEKHQWAIVDLTSRNILVTNSDGDFLNSVDLLYANHNKSYDGLKAAVYKKGQIIDSPYLPVSHYTQLYFTDYATLLFDPPNEDWESHLSKLYSYLFKPQHRYSLARPNDWKYSVKQGLILAQLLLIPIWLMVGWRYWSRRRSARPARD